jgi:hypothetical protein
MWPAPEGDPGDMLADLPVTLVAAVPATGNHRQDFPKHLAKHPTLGHFAA